MNAIPKPVSRPASRGTTVFGCCSEPQNSCGASTDQVFPSSLLAAASVEKPRPSGPAGRTDQATPAVVGVSATRGRPESRGAGPTRAVLRLDGAPVAT